MNVDKIDGEVRITFEMAPGNALAAVIIRNAEDMTGGLLDLSSLLRQAYYAARDKFEQPPHAFDEQAPRFPSA